MKWEGSGEGEVGGEIVRRGLLHHLCVHESCDRHVTAIQAIDMTRMVQVTRHDT